MTSKGPQLSAVLHEEYYAAAEAIFRWALTNAAFDLLREREKLGISRLAEVQAHLREHLLSASDSPIAGNRFSFNEFLMTELQKSAREADDASGTGDLTSTLKDRWADLADASAWKLGNEIVPNLASAVSIEAYCLAHWAIAPFPGHREWPVVPPRRKSAKKLRIGNLEKLRGCIERLALGALPARDDRRDRCISVLKDCLKRVVDALSGASTPVPEDIDHKKWSASLVSAIEACDPVNAVPSIGGGLFVVADIPESLSDEHLRLWAYTKIVAHIIQFAFGTRSLCDIYVPTDAGDLPVVASSGQESPRLPPRLFGTRLVGSGRLQGGVGTAIRAPIPNDLPSSFTTSHYDEEDRPSRVVTVPVLARPGADYPIGQLVVNLYGDVPKLRDTPELFGLILCIADSIHDPMPSLLSGSSSWRNFLAHPREFASGFSEGLRHVIKDAHEDVSETLRSAVVLIVSEPTSDRRLKKEVSDVLDVCAKSAALGIARDSTVYRIGDAHAYVVLKRGMNEDEWLELRSREFFGKDGVVEVCDPFGHAAGKLATWSIPLRHDVLVRERADHTEDLVETLTKQVHTARYQLIDPSGQNQDMCGYQAACERLDYEQAFAIAGVLVDGPEGSYCPLVNEFCRMAILLGDFKSAAVQIYERLLRTPWDVDARANLVLVQLATLGEQAEAVRPGGSLFHLPKGLGHGKLDRYPMLVLGRVFMQALWLAGSEQSRTSLEVKKSELRRELNGCARSLRSSDLTLSRKALSSALDYVFSLPNSSDSLEELFDAAFQELIKIPRDSNGRTSRWGEIAALRRALIVLKAMTRRLAARQGVVPQEFLLAIAAQDQHIMPTQPSF